MSFGARLSQLRAIGLLDAGGDACQSRRVKSCGPSGSQDLAFLGVVAIIAGVSAAFLPARPAPRDVRRAA
jgi:hypothetical protein